MCVVGVKYIQGYGWVGAKNRDRNYKTEVHIVQSNRKNIQRLYIDDQLSRWTEGVNEYGVSVVSASFSVKSDEKEGDKVVDKRSSKRNQPGYYSPDGRKVRNSLLFKTPLKAINYLAKEELAGATYVFNEEECYLMEGGFTVKKEDASKDNPREFIYKIKEISREVGYSCRTNHGIDIPELGYKKDADDEKIIRSRKSSEKRYDIVCKSISKDLRDPSELLDSFAETPEDDKFMNPIRVGNPKKGDMVTTGQLLIVAKERTLHYRPIFSTVRFEYDKINGPDAKTFFEIISTRKLLSFKEYFDKKNIYK
jgi:hypothetical protein